MDLKTIDQIRSSYDALATQYTERIFDELRHKPLDRSLLTRFANSVRRRGTVCDLGCGPGHVTAFLRDANIDVFGLDLSPRLLEEARRLSPEISFREGNMLELPISSGLLGGITSFYSIVNIPNTYLPLVFAEMFRVLRPGGALLLAFHVGNEAIAMEHLWDVKIKLDFFLFDPTEICVLLRAAGFTIEELIERAPYPEVEYPSRRAYIFAIKGAQ